MSEFDKEILKTEKTIYNFVNNIKNETGIPFTNDQEFCNTLQKKITDYEKNAAEIILKNLEKHELPSKLMRMNQFKLKNKFYSKVMSRSEERSRKNQLETKEDKIRPYHMFHYLCDTSIAQIKKTKDFDFGKDLDNFPFIVGDSVNAICEANEFLQKILDDEEEEQRTLLKNLVST